MEHNICDQSIKKLKQKLRDVTCDDIKIFCSVNHFYNRYLKIFFPLYNECFPKIKIKIKPQKYFLPWVTLDIRMFPKIKQRLFEKSLKTRTAKNKAEYKTRENLFGTIKSKNNAKKMKYYERVNRPNK